MTLLAALGFMALGSYLTGLVTVLWATSEPWPDRAGIALAWPIALGFVLWRG